MALRPPGFWFIALAAFCSMASMRVCDPMLLALSQEFVVSLGRASQAISAFALAYGLLQLFYGPLGDRLGKWRVVRGAALACALLCALSASVVDFEHLVLARAALGACAAGIIPLSMAWVGDQVPYERRQEVLAQLMSATVTGMMAGQWFGAWAAQNWGWRSAFVLLAALFALAGALLHTQNPGMATPATPATPANTVNTVNTVSYWHSLKTSGALLRLASVRWLLGVTALEGALAFGTLAFVPSHVVQQFGLSASQAGGLMLLYGLGGLLYSQQARRWLAWRGERGLARLGSTLVALALLLLAWATQALWAVLACLLAGLGFYMLHNTLQTRATQLAPHARGSAVTLFACCLFLGQSAGVLLVALSADAGHLPWALSAAALGMLVLGRHIAARLKAQKGASAKAR